MVWLGTPFVARLSGGFWVAGCLKTRDPGAPSWLEELIRRWADSGAPPAPPGLVEQGLLEASIHGGLVLLYEYRGRLAPISKRLTGKPLGLASTPGRAGGARSVSALEGWARLTLYDDVDWLDGLGLEYPEGYMLVTGSGPGLCSPCAYVESGRAR